MASDKLFYSIFHDQPDLILRWLHDLPADAAGYRFSAPVLKEREYRLDGLFLPPEERSDCPAIVLEAQMAPDRKFLARLYAESGRFVQQVLPLIAAILLARFNDRPISEICAMGGLSLDDFTKSRAYREIYREGEVAGEARGVALGEARGEASVTLRLLNRRCGTLSAATTARIQALPLGQLESLADALLDFTGPEDLQAWLRKQT